MRILKVQIFSIEVNFSDYTVWKLFWFIPKKCYSLIWKWIPKIFFRQFRTIIILHGHHLHHKVFLQSSPKGPFIINSVIESFSCLFRIILICIIYCFISQSHLWIWCVHNWRGIALRMQIHFIEAIISGLKLCHFKNLRKVFFFSYCLSNRKLCYVC